MNLINQDNLLWVSIVTGLLVVMAVLLFYFYRKNKRLGVRMRRDTEEVEQLMTLSLRLTGNFVIEYDIKRDRFSNRYGGQLLPQEGCSMAEFLSFIHPDYHPVIKEDLERFKRGELSYSSIDFKLSSPRRSGDGESLFYHGDSVLELDDLGRPEFVATTMKDLTKELEANEREAELVTRFSQIFDNALVAISFYHHDGTLIGLNKKMCELCEIEDPNNNFFTALRLNEFELIKDDFNLLGDDYLHACQHLLYPHQGVDKFIEFRIRPVFDKDSLEYYIMTARDVSDEREMYLEQDRVNKELMLLFDKVNLHEQELNYLLSNSAMWVWWSDVKKREIVFSRSLKHPDVVMPFEKFAETVVSDELDVTMKDYYDQHKVVNKLNKVVEFKETPISNQLKWGYITGLPSYYENGELRGHFGILRDVTDLIEAQEQLKRETLRAEDSGKLKSVFLANMTHEIRTPLNSIVGFSDLLQMVDSAEDRKEFMRIIRINCDMLIRLIDDIIEASNLNQGPLAIEPADVDFAVVFDDICQTLSQRVESTNIQFMSDNPYKTFKTCVDQGRLQQVITNFTTNAVKYTKEGYVKVGYRYEKGGIYMYCEDTGAGIPKDKQEAIFERFVKLNDFIQGTGLGLSICKSIAEQCGGKIGVKSEGEGTGSVFWVWIPCDCKEIVSK